MGKFQTNLVVKIVLAIVFIILVPVSVNKFLLKEFFLSLSFDEDTGRAVRGIISGLLLSPILYAWFYGRFYKEKLQEMKPEVFLPGLITGVSLASFVLLPVVLVLRITGIIYNVEPVRPEQFWYGFTMILVLAVTEEIFFRGILYRIIEERYSYRIAIVATAVLFTLSHLANDNFTWVSILSVTAGSVILGQLFTLGHSLWMPVFFHFTWNMIQVVIGLPVSGLSSFFGSALLKVSISGPDLVTGGDFGLENSLIVISLLFSACLVLHWRIKRESRFTS